MMGKDDLHHNSGGALLAAITLSPCALAQELQVGSNAYVDMYFADWHSSRAETAGPVTEYAVFTKGDPLSPQQGRHPPLR